MVKDIIHERSNLNYEANQEVRSKWAFAQTVTPPMISVPIVEEYIKDDEKSYYTSMYHFLPETLEIASNVEPRKLKRGIYEVIVYNSDVNITGSFSIPEEFDPSDYFEVKWDEAFATVGITDLRGIKNNIILDWNGNPLTSDPGSKINKIINSGLSFPLPNLKKESKGINFNLEIDLQGSTNLAFIPTGKNTKLKMSSSWPDPSFVGDFLPDSREITKDGFSADWEILQINRNFPQHWKNQEQVNLTSNSTFGVNFILPSDAYQKSIRSIKYALMNIVLTFLIFFIVEIFTKIKIHPFQYIMVGLSIVLFYILLVSISEHLNFDNSYLISAFSIISMIYLYSLSVFKSLKFSLYLLGLSILNYGFIYITLQMTEYALVLGAISMTTILAVVMYTTRNINWYALGKSPGVKKTTLANEQ